MALPANGSTQKIATRDEIGHDQQAPTGEPVDERREQEADQDDRKEVGDQESADPRARLGPVVDVDGEGDRSEVGSRTDPNVATKRRRKSGAVLRRSRRRMGGS